MPEAQLRRRHDGQQQLMCGTSYWHPDWMQKFATTKYFMYVYGLLGTIQAMSYMYFVVSLTTIEKRFKIPSQTTGIILSGNEISQILLSLILSYIGGQRNRPKWIAWGIVFCGLSCYILALPHFIYGPGDDALRLTEEYLNETNIALVNSTLTTVKASVTPAEQLCDSPELTSECNALLSIVPLILIFLSQFVLGVGNTLYYSLGQTYLDDNTKKTNTPVMLSIAMALRMIGPIFGFFLGYLCLNMYIDPTKTPIIDTKDPRWLGAWWFGWTILGTLMVLFSGLIGLFPKQLPKVKKLPQRNTHLPQFLQQEETQLSENLGLHLDGGFASTATLDEMPGYATELPKLKDLPKALMRLLRNKLLILNIVSGVFFILGATGFMTFLSRYMEVQFHKSAQSATIVTGPVSILGMIIGLVGSGVFISKVKPHASKVLMWNVFVGCIYVGGQVAYMFMYCPDSISNTFHGSLNLTADCNANCICEGVPYSPVCHEPTETTFFSACHAGCYSYDSTHKIFSNCSCLAENSLTTPFASSTSQSSLMKLLKSTTSQSIMTTTTTTTTITAAQVQQLLGSLNTKGDSNEFISSETIDFQYEDTTTEGLLERSRRAASGTLESILTPGICLKGCSTAFYTFAITSMIVNWFGSSGRIGNILVNYRAVAPEDKSFAQGLSLMMISLFALIPGPIIFGRIIDSTCLLWTKTCNGNGNCQLYDQTAFRYMVNGFGCFLTSIGAIIDAFVWYYGRHIDLYGENDVKRLEETKRRNQPISPLLTNRQQ